MATKRDLKENFVSGWGGTTLTEINVISCTPDIALSIFNLLILNNSRLQDRAILLSFLLLVAPMVFQLLGPLSPVWVFIGLLMCLVLLMGQLRKFSKLLRHQYDWEMGLKQSLTIHRAFVMLITCVAILAVDFRAFPRRLAKTEFFGTGLMDAGVGSMIAAGAFVQGMRCGTAPKREGSEYFRFNRKLKQTLLLIVLGMSRFVATEFINYQKHVGEYGIHWNFFLTLAVMRVMRDFVLQPLAIYSSPAATFVSGSIILFTHQSLLSLKDLIGFINAEGARHKSLIFANKEGIFSLPGYVALDLLGASCGSALAWISRKRPVNSLSRVAHLLILNILLWAGYFVAALIQPVSRRACNASYVLWMLSLNIQSVSLGLISLIVTEQRAVPALLQAVNGSMLPTFLVANLLTGGVNIMLDTLQVGNNTARGIVLIYMLITCSFSLLFARR